MIERAWPPDDGGPPIGPSPAEIPLKVADLSPDAH
jgi:hypothetical protein